MTTRPRHPKTNFVRIGLGYLILLVFISGCTKTIHTESTGPEGPTPIVTIREFPDVPIPKELDLDAKESFVVYAAPDIAAGLLVYDGNVDYDSLVRFFNQTLTKEGWIFRGSLKYARTLLFYQKETKVCLVTMKSEPLNVRVEIWVTPLEAPFYETVVEPVLP